MTNFITNSIQQNFYMKNDVAYTEDHIPVKKLFFYRVANGTTLQQLNNHFVEFGNIKHIRISNNRNGRIKGRKGRPITKMGYVNFTNAQDAAKALLHRPHIVKGNRLCVQASDSWHQPDAYGKYGQIKEKHKNDKKVETAPIFKLNDHCLEHVFKFLALADQVRFARTCLRFRNIYQLVSPMMHKSLRLGEFDNMTVWDMRDFFLLSGSYVQSIEGNLTLTHVDRFVIFFKLHCRNIKFINLTGSEIKTRHMFKMFAHLNDLEKLTMQACTLQNNCLSALKNLKKLKYLGLSDNLELTGLYFNRLPASIEILKLERCFGLKPIHLPSMCSNLPKLRELNLTQIRNIPTSVFRDLAAAAPALEVLIVNASTQCEYEYIANLPSLKKLIIHVVPPPYTLRAELFAQLAQLKSDQLEYLELDGTDLISTPMVLNIAKINSLRTLIISNSEAINSNALLEMCKLTQLEHLSLRGCSNIEDNALVRLLIACPKLHILHLEDCQVTSKLVYDAIRRVGMQVSNRENERDLPIELYVHNTKIDQDLLNDSNYIPGKNIVNAIFDVPKPEGGILEQHFANLFDNQGLLPFEIRPAQFDSDDDDMSDEHLFDAGFLSNCEDDSSSLDSGPYDDLVGQIDNEYELAYVLDSSFDNDLEDDLVDDFDCLDNSVDFTDNFEHQLAYSPDEDFVELVNNYNEHYLTNDLDDDLDNYFDNDVANDFEDFD